MSEILSLINVNVLKQSRLVLFVTFVFPVNILRELFLLVLISSFLSLFERNTVNHPLKVCLKYLIFVYKRFAYIFLPLANFCCHRGNRSLPCINNCRDDILVRNTRDYFDFVYKGVVSGQEKNEDLVQFPFWCFQLTSV